MSWASDKAREISESEDGCGGFNDECRSCRCIERAIRETIERCAEVGEEAQPRDYDEGVIGAAIRKLAE